MAMQPCKQCCDNVWKYEYIEGYVKATCQMCGNEVEFATKKEKKRLKREQVKEYITHKKWCEEVEQHQKNIVYKKVTI